MQLYTKDGDLLQDITKRGQSQRLDNEPPELTLIEIFHFEYIYVKNCTLFAAKRFRFHILPSNTGMIFARTWNPELETLIKIYIYTTAIGLCIGGETLDRKRKKLILPGQNFDFWNFFPEYVSYKSGICCKAEDRL